MREARLSDNQAIDENDAGLPESARRVQRALRAAGSPAIVVEMPASTRTAAEAADACGCRVAEIAKSLVFENRETGEPVLVVTSGANRVHEKRLSRALGIKLGRADAERVRATTGYAIGGIPPIGHDEPILTVIDADLEAFDVVWAAAGTPRCVFKTTGKELIVLTGGRVMVVT